MPSPLPLHPPPPKHHLVLPFAACTSENWLPAIKALPPATFRHFGKLLQGMKLMDNDRGEEHSLSTPHERVQAKALGLDAADGLIPWAAWRHLQTGGSPGAKAWAHITPCHWAMGREHATMTDPAALDLQEGDSRVLLAAMQPYFETYGITLHYAQPTRWLAEGEVFRTLPAASLDRVLGRNVDPWLPGGVAGRATRLLQNEMQMLLYTHPVNDARSARGQRGVNSFWISDSGALPDNFSPAQLQPELTAPRTLAHAAFNDDWAAYAEAWAALDASEGARLLALQQSGETVRLSLCGERNASTFETSKTGILTTFTRLFGQPPFVSVLEQL
ncbi:MAG TPA: hypothetical protein VE934_07515 [Polaromonas sp.]|uniref:hypothetical protein n=1 Tax=Polaromonas sp. TaxID=1869339 RepID=UPI002D2DFD5D|nr:hypothetical protein [Polaromonas sp.]HYW56791.1 hypothetical protein [Polaromonas sp.]